jgi:hypothetical protein
VAENRRTRPKKWGKQPKESPRYEGTFNLHQAVFNCSVDVTSDGSDTDIKADSFPPKIV